MGSWRDEILKQFTPGVARLTLAADPDGLLTEEGVLEGLRERGFELIPFEDPIAFRFAYESKYRSRWDAGELTELVVVLRSPGHDLGELPYDLLQAGRQLRFNLADLFPHLSPRVLDALDRSDLDAVYEAVKQHDPGELGENATADFVLRHAFHLVPEIAREPADLLRLLLEKHYGHRRIPAHLDARMVRVLRQNTEFAEWPLEELVPHRQAFYSFLQERWPAFLDTVAAVEEHQLGEQTWRGTLQFPGPTHLPFGHDNVRVYIDNLFVDGTLKPVEHQKSEVLSRQWVSIGLRTDPERRRSEQLAKLLVAVESALPTKACPHQAWLAFAQRWGALLAAIQSGGADTDHLSQVARLRSRIDEAFGAWTMKRYHTLHNLPSSPPVMVHHVARYLAHCRLDRDGCEKVALLVVDGLAYDQWVTLRDVLVEQRPSLRFEESALFSWVPTLTSVCRQAMFAGRAPLYFPATIGSTNHDASAWTQFWVDRGLTPRQVLYMREVDGASASDVENRLSDPEVVSAGLVVGAVDKIMHGIQTGTAGMHNQVAQWAQQGLMAELLDQLHTLGFTTFVTSDHGNIEATGLGSPSEGVIAETRGQRVRVYPQQVLRSKVAGAFPESLEWPTWALPEDFLPLIASGRAAFVKQEQRIVSHGGATLEEVVVPFVEVSAEQTRPKSR